MVILDISTKYRTIAEYLEMEDISMARHEFYNGTIIQMAGGTVPHNVIKLRLGGMLDRMLETKKFPHVALNSDTKVRIERHNRFVYPDVTISDEMPEYYTTPDGQTRRDIIVNPLVIFEVLSDDTRSFDKGEKSEQLASIPGLREYILIEPESVWVKSQYLHDPIENLWRIEILTDRAAMLTVRSLGLQLSLDEIYSALDKLPPVIKT